MDYKDSLLAIGEAGWSVCWQSDMTISMRRKAIGSNAIPCSGEHAGEPKALFCFSICDLPPTRPVDTKRYHGCSTVCYCTWYIPFCIAQESAILETRSARASLGSHFTPQQPTRPYEEERTKTEDASTTIFSAKR